jgi:hypothetical protein
MRNGWLSWLLAVRPPIEDAVIELQNDFRPYEVGGEADGQPAENGYELTHYGLTVVQAGTVMCVQPVHEFLDQTATIFREKGFNPPPELS